MDYKIKKINGIETIFVPMESNSVTVEIGVKAGSLYEGKKMNGISHFLEHMFFKGGEIFKTPQSVTEAIDNIGGELNAYTGKNMTGFYVKVAPEYLKTAITLLGDMFVNQKFDEKEIKREKNVIIQELKMNKDNHQNVLYEKFAEFYYGKDNAYGRNIIGKEDNILNFTEEDLINYKNSLYTKDNMVISIAGKIEEIENIEELISKSFDKLPDKKTKKIKKFKGVQTEIKEGFYKKDVEQNHIIIAMPGFKNTEDERFEMALLATILGGNMSSILFQKIREKLGLCYYISASHSSSNVDGTFYISAGIDKTKFKKGIKKINEILDKIVDGEISEESLQKAKGFFLGKTKMGIETSDEMTNYILDQYLLTGEIIKLEDFLEKINKITLDDIKKVTGKLSKENRYLYYLD